MKVVALYHIKGGVGKTSSAVNLAWCAAHAGARTLLWDLDPQGAATFYFRVKPKLKGGLKHLVGAKSQATRHIKATDFEGLDLLPADFSLRLLDLALHEAKRPRKQLRKALEPLLGEYDRIFLDCPPNLTLVTENILRAADVVLCPVIPTTLSERTLAQLRAHIKEAGESVHLWPFFSMVERRKSLHAALLESLPQTLGPFLNTQIPYLSDIERMGLHREPVGVTRASAPAAKAYAALYAELDALMTNP